MLPFNLGVGGASGVDTGDIPASLRFRGAQYLTRSQSNSNGKFGFSIRIKRTSFGTTQTILNARNYGNAGLSYPYTQLYFNSSDKLCFDESYSGVTRCALVTDAVFRDPTSHVDIEVWYDYTNATAADRVILKRNGERLSVTGTNHTGSATCQIGVSGVALDIGCGRVAGTGAATNLLEGYVSRPCLYSGGVPSANSFNSFNTEINEWVTKSQSVIQSLIDSGDANSSMLDFDNGTSLTTLGYDKSSKGNNWTLNNFSLTAGTTYDWMLDVPGNSFPTYSPVDQSLTTESEGNLKVTTNVGGYSGACRAAMAIPTTGQWYWETSITANGGSAGQAPVTGIMTTSSRIVTAGWACYGYYGATGYKQQYVSGSLSVNASYGSTYTAGDIIGIAYDADAGTITFYKNGVSQGTAFTGITGEYKPVLWDPSTGGTAIGNFGQAPLFASATYDSASGGYFRYAPPTGYKALCQRNLPDPAILNPEKHFDVVTRSGNSTNPYSVSGLLFPPDLVWIKGRSNATDHMVNDSVRGGNKTLYSNRTNAEVASDTGGYLSAFTSDGYTLAQGSTDFTNVNTSGRTYVDWLWKAGGAAVTNNAGSISSQVSANVEAGLSIVTYTGTGANATVGHGLGKAPGLVIIKGRGAAWNWVVYNHGIGGGNYLSLNSTIASAGDATMWNNTSPTSSVFSVGTNGNANANGNTYVAYCFTDIEGYSKIFSYTGNGSADGPFVHCGFKPKYVLIKRTDSAADWIDEDAARNPSNVSGMSIIYPNSASAEYTGGLQDFDLVSSGLKLRSTHVGTNASGGTYIGIAFADVPAKYSLAR